LRKRVRSVLKTSSFICSSHKISYVSFLIRKTLKRTDRHTHVYSHDPHNLAEVVGRGGKTLFELAMYLWRRSERG